MTRTSTSGAEEEAWQDARPGRGRVTHQVKTIQKYLDRGFVVKASLGHLKDLPKSKLGIDVKKRLRSAVRPRRTKAKTLEDLKKAGKRAKALYVATDPDREGRRSAGTSPRSSSLPPDRVCRVLFNEITEKAVKAAFKSPGASTRSGRPAGAARARPPGRLQDQPAPLGEDPPRSVGGARPVGRRSA